MSGVVSAPPRRVEALAYIIDRIRRSGTAPSYREVGLALNPCVNRTRARELVDELVEIGVIERPPASRRGIRIRDLDLCRQMIEEALGQKGWAHASPIGVLVPVPCTFEHLTLLPLIEQDRAVH